MNTAIQTVKSHPLTHNSTRVVTTELLAQIYETEVKNIQMNFKRNSERFEEGKHFYKLQGDELKEFKHLPTVSGLVDLRTPSLMLWTEKGASRHCKMLDTDKAWERFDELEETYFKVQEVKAAFPVPRTYAEALQAHLDSIKQLEEANREIKALAPKVEFAESLMDSETLVTTNQVAMQLGVSAMKLNKFLNEQRVIYKQGKNWLLNSNYRKRGVAKLVAHKFFGKNGEVRKKEYIKWTSLGQAFIYHLWNCWDDFGEKAHIYVTFGNYMDDGHRFKWK